MLSIELLILNEKASSMTTIDCESPEIDNASRYERKEGQAFFADFVKGNQLRWLPGPSLLTRSQCRPRIQKEAWHCSFFLILWTIMFKEGQMDCEVSISGLPNLRHVNMLRIRKVQALRKIDVYQAQVFMSIFC